LEVTGLRAQQRCSISQRLHRAALDAAKQNLYLFTGLRAL